MRRELPGKPTTEEDAERRLEDFLGRYGPLLRRAVAAACPRGLSRQIDDIEQEARIRLWRALRAETTILDPASYLYRVAITATIDAVRRSRARPEDPTPDERLDAFSGREEADPERDARAKEVTSAVDRAASRLSHDRRRAVLLHLQGFNVAEIARLIGGTHARARNLAYRGLADLRRALAEDGITL
ncbi:MAG TPA: RNA polymerase sigma factor [Thermoanaerobaculia bacterium]|jgi:RNA polymerase sigma-70 factor (ECF subfamily)